MTVQQQTASRNGAAADQGSDAASGNGRSVEQTVPMPSFAPPSDIYETKEDVQLYLDMPGADPSSLDVTLDRRILAVSARCQPWRPQGYTLIAAEYQDGNYERSFVLSDQLDGEKIEANFKDGVLCIRVPKAPPSQAKKIPVNAA
ncbi:MULTISPECIES: Hsp20/alpha crystallin family protein [Rhodomicrobium]|uniref:Hsp20/alpha crystallin family protein n=1 Tax=Rhodomicrobium TaxID=1068 RepID=UPI001FD9A847|nr:MULTISPECIES: Hsp20/alpha crystallin family protein [Rhodomicrobium]